jgi:flagellar biosynthesis protein FlhF
MKVKSFYGNSIKDALDKARRELGPDAAIVASRQLRPEEGGGCEVVCGMEENSRSASDRTAQVNERRGPNSKGTLPQVVRGRAAQPDAPAAAQPPAIPAAPEARAKRGVTRIRKQIEALVQPAVRSSDRMSQDDGFGSDKVRAELLAAGFAEDLANEIIAGVRQRQRQGVERTAALLEELSSRLAFAPQLGGDRAERRIVAFVGPPGAGKTTMLVKLAVRYGLRGRKPMHIISMDSWRIGGADALRTYAAGMGVTFEAIETAEALRQSLEEHTGKGLILIDTPGLGPADMKAFAPLASVLSTHPEAEVHLVVPAHFSPSAMASLAQRFRPFLPSKLAITNADAVESCLPAAALALSLERPVSFIGTGQLIPEDMEEASAERLLGSGVKDSMRKTATSAA